MIVKCNQHLLKVRNLKNKICSAWRWLKYKHFKCQSRSNEVGIWDGMEAVMGSNLSSVTDALFDWRVNQWIQPQLLHLSKDDNAPTSLDNYNDYSKLIIMNSWIIHSIFWPPDAKRQLNGKDSDAGKDWGQKKRAAENEMVGWHHRFNGHKLGWTLGNGEGQGGMACCSSWGHKESDTT